MPPSNESQFHFKGNYFTCPLGVYPPSEDSYFLAENTEPGKCELAIDTGCGTGIQTINLLQKGAKKVVAIDLNPKALSTTLSNARKAGFEGKVETLRSDLFEQYRGKKADFIVFNPPYLPSENKKHIDLDGGKHGREVLDRFIEQFPLHLKKKGRCVFLQTNINGYKKTEKMLSKEGFEFRQLKKLKGFFEELTIYQATKT